MSGYEDYMERLTAGDKRGCYELIQGHLRAGKDIRELYYGVFQPAMRRIGQLWESNSISVAQEHVATAITQHMMATLYDRLFQEAGEAGDKRVMITCPAGELHELPSRMLADLLVLEGVDVVFVGASAPAEAVVKMLEEEAPDMLVVSCTISRHVPAVKGLIEAVRSNPQIRASVLVGGHAFDRDPGLHARIGADHYGATFEESVRLIMGQEVPCHAAG